MYNQLNGDEFAESLYQHDVERQFRGTCLAPRTPLVIPFSSTSSCPAPVLLNEQHCVFNPNV